MIVAITSKNKNTLQSSVWDKEKEMKKETDLWGKTSPTTLGAN